MESTLDRIAARAALHGYLLRAAPRAALGPVEGYEGPLLATFDGVEVVYANDLPFAEQLYLAIHGLGHSMGWALRPEERETKDYADLHVPRHPDMRMLGAQDQEIWANSRGLALVEGLLSPEEMALYKEEAEKDWKAYRRHLHKAGYTNICWDMEYVWVPPEEFSHARGRVRLAGAFALSPEGNEG